MGSHSVRGARWCGICAGRCRLMEKPSSRSWRHTLAAPFQASSSRRRHRRYQGHETRRIRQRPDADDERPEVSTLRSPSVASVFPLTIHAYTSSRSAPANRSGIYSPPRLHSRSGRPAPRPACPLCCRKRCRAPVRQTLGQPSGVRQTRINPGLTACQRIHALVFGGASIEDDVGQQRHQFGLAGTSGLFQHLTQLRAHSRDRNPAG